MHRAVLHAVVGICHRHMAELLEFAGLNSSEIEALEFDMDEATGFALRNLGYVVIEPKRPSNEEVAALRSADMDAFMELIETRLLDNLFWAYKDGKADLEDKRIGKVVRGIAIAISMRRKIIRERYGVRV